MPWRPDPARPPRASRETVRPGLAVPASLARANALPIGWTLRGGRAPHWSSGGRCGGAAGPDWRTGGAGAASAVSMAAPARRSVVFVTGNAKKLEEVRAAGPGPGERVCLPPCLASPSLFTPFSLRRSRRSSGTPLPTRWWRRKLTVSYWRGPGGCGGSSRSGRLLSTDPCVRSARVPGGAR